ncbi:MAG: CBS domain-containing protein, partial [Lachnospiraceae bacterium]|nr:CBS domain-containing protein [Lachnospiraceae bacterium]
MAKKVEEIFICKREDRVATALRKLDENSRGIVFVVDDKEKLIGAMTDGDIRRWLIKTGNLEATVGEIMNPNPLFLLKKDSEKAERFMKKNRINAVPLLGSHGTIKDIRFLLDDE